jgi:hypothetical protein
MAQHGYLREYDEGWDRSDNRDRERERAWRNDDRSSNDQRSNFMLSDRDHNWNRASSARAADYYSRPMEYRDGSWFRDDNPRNRGAMSDRSESTNIGRSGRSGNEQRYDFQGYDDRLKHQPGDFGGRGNWEHSSRIAGSSQDDHYRSWRDRQMRALDRDYEDYCREREQQFHQDFDSWRNDRRQQHGHAGSSEEVMELNNPTNQSTEPHSGPSATADATLGTNNSENSGVGRGGR